MKRLLYLLSGLLPICTFAQSTGLPLNFGSYGIRLGVAADESLAMATRAGEIGLRPVDGAWHRADIHAASKTPLMGLGMTLEQPIFFNKDTGFVSGFIKSAESDKYNIVYRTTDGGQRWKAVNFGQDGWVDDAAGLDNGEAWLSVSGSGIAYTTDYGTTWKRLRHPGGSANERYTAVFFNNTHEGIAGSLSNRLAYTANNCESWTFLPTPLSQGKYRKTDKQSRPELNRVAIYKNYFLATQEGLVFYTLRNNIEWIWLPGYTDFYTDAENSALFFKTGKENFVKVDDHLQPEQTFRLDVKTYDAKCKHGNLFVVSDDNLIRLDARGGTTSTSFNLAPAKREPLLFGYLPNGYFGIMDNAVYRQAYSETLAKTEWIKLFTLPYSADNGAWYTVTETNSLLYARSDDSLFYFSQSGKLQRATSKSALLAGFIKSGISGISFKAGSQGCFHHFEARLEYTRADGQFGNPVATEEKRAENLLPANPQIITESDVNGFLAQLPDIFSGQRKTTFEDLGFTNSDYEQCKKNIRQFQAWVEGSKESNKSGFEFNRNNLDFDRLIRLVDSVKTMDDTTLQDKLINLQRFESTTTNWTTVLLTNNKGEVLTLNSSYYEPNAYHFPWQVSLDGYSFLSVDIRIYRFIKTIYPELLNDAQRVDVLQELVKKMYRQTSM